VIRIWRVDRLVRDLREGRLTARDRLHYCVASVALHGVLGPALLPIFQTEKTAIWTVCRAAIALLGLALTFHANGGRAGQSFVVRYCCLALPILLRTCVIGYATYYALSYGAEILGPPSLTQPSVKVGATVAFGLLLVAGYFAALYRAFRSVAAPPSA
jgi:hypothetical protein